MNLDQYERFGRARYQKFAATVSKLLERAIAQDPGLRLQQIQHRAKMIESLTRRLKEIGQSDTNDIESYRKDLAGCRIIFYTNNDVNRFARSSILSDLFEVDWDRSNFHHPRIDEKSTTRFFQSYNYVLALKANRISLLEYQEFHGLYCEVQVQTSLNHTWAEMAHDTIYKQTDLKGFGTRELGLIDSRLQDVMRKHLLPAGYLFQRIASDVQRISEGKALIDAGVLDTVLAADNNNLRHEALARFKDDVLSHYDDLPDVYPEISDKLKEAWILAINTETVPRETPFGSLHGTDSHEVTAQIAEIIERYRYLDVEQTYALVRDLYRQTSNPKSRGQLIDIAEHLASNTAQVWQHSGPVVQVTLAGILKQEEDIESIGPLIVIIATSIFDPEIRGTTPGSNTVTIHRGTIGHSEALEVARKTMIDVVAGYAGSMTDNNEEFRSAIECLFSAGRRPHGGAGADVIAMIFLHLAHAVGRITRLVSMVGFDSRQYIESHLLRYWKWNRSLPQHLVSSDNVIAAYAKLIDAMLRLRNILNADDDFVTFKTIVGYESVFPHMWEEGQANFSRNETVRNQAQDRLADTITGEDWPLWKSRLVDAASVKSHDGATFLPYLRFLSIVAERHPDLAFDLLDDDDMPAWTMRPIAEVLLGSNLREKVETLLTSWLEEGRHLEEIAALAAFSEKVDTPMILKIAMDAVERRDVSSCLCLMEGAIRRFADDRSFWRDRIFFPCLAVSKEKVAYHWIGSSWHQPEMDSLFSSLTAVQSVTLLEAMVGVPDIDYPAEQILKEISSAHHQLVLDWFGRRIYRTTDETSAGFEPVPFQFQVVHEVLQPYPRDIIATMRQWSDSDSGMGSWYVSHFLSRIYPNYEEPLPSTLLDMVESADASELVFIVSSLQGFEGRSDLLPLLRTVLTSDAADDDIERHISHVLQETGIMRGEFGVANTYQAKADQLKTWLEDDDNRVSTFAAREIRSFERMVAVETRRAQEEIAMRRLQYGESLDGNISNGTTDIGNQPSADDIGLE